MSSTRFLREPGGRAPALDMAISQAVLEAVARGEPGALRIYRPAPTLAFGRLDGLRAEPAAVGLFRSPEG